VRRSIVFQLESNLINNKPPTPPSAPHYVTVNRIKYQLDNWEVICQSGSVVLIVYCNFVSRYQFYLDIVPSQQSETYSAIVQYILYSEHRVVLHIGV